MSEENNIVPPEGGVEQDDLFSGERTGIAEEFFLFLKENKAYWLAPIILVLLLLGALVFLGGGAAAPFIYTLF